MEDPKQEEEHPRRRLNFQYNGSDLYDSFELRQMTYQLNKAMMMQASIASSSSSSSSSPAYHEMKQQKHQLNKAFQSPTASSSPASYIFHLNSPLYHRQLNFLYRESTRNSRGISGPQVKDKGRAYRRGTRESGFLTSLWVKVKKGLFG